MPPDGSLDMTTNVRIITDMSVARHGLCPNGRRQVLPHDVHIYPREFLCRLSRAQSALPVPANCFAAHDSCGPWLSGGTRLRKKAIDRVAPVIPPSAFSAIRKLKRKVCETVRKLNQ